METDTLSKSQQKKLNKKLKADGGKVVATGSADDEKKTKKEKKEKQKEKEKKDVETEVKEKAKKGATTATKTLEGGVKMTDIKAGTGPQAKKGKTASIRYVGKFPNGKIFDRNVSGKTVSLVVLLRFCV
jgi:FK506-binding nuclear protein